MTVKSARILVEVTAGLIPEQPDPQFTKKWVITNEEWDACPDHGFLLAEFNGKALGYAGLLMLQPNIINWVRTDFIYL